MEQWECSSQGRLFPVYGKELNKSLYKKKDMYIFNPRNPEAEEGRQIYNFKLIKRS